jgi:hypothetical protein
MKDNLTQKLHDLELELLKPDVRTSYEKLDELLDNDFVEYGSSGNKYTKEMILDRLPSSMPLKYKLSDFEIVQLSENFVQTRFKTDRENEDGSHTISLRTSIWKNTDSNWKMFYHQATPLK